MLDIVLIDDEDAEILECEDCGQELIDPYWSSHDGEAVICSTCAGQDYLAWRKERDAEAHEPEPGLEPPKCECGYTLDKCHAGTCQGLAEPPKRRSVNPRQMKLF